MTERILMVDDSEIILEAVGDTLRGAGFEVMTTTNPLLVASELRKNKPSLVLMDVDMPALKGPQVVEALHRSGITDAAIVLYSATSEPSGLAQMAEQCGAVGSIPKAVTGADLVQRVRDFLPSATTKAALVVTPADVSPEIMGHLRLLGLQPEAHGALGLDRPLREGGYDLLVAHPRAFTHPPLPAMLGRLQARGLLAGVAVVVLGPEGGDAQVDPEGLDANRLSAAVDAARSAARRRA
jgi:CheY-like chemotaxis protein